MAGYPREWFRRERRWTVEKTLSFSTAVNKASMAVLEKLS